MWRSWIPRLLQGPRALFGLCLCVFLLYLYVRGRQQHHIQPELRDEAAKLREQKSARNEVIKTLQDQNWDLQSKIDKMQGDLHRCRNASGKQVERVQGLERSLENNEVQNSNLRKEMSTRNEMIKKLQDKIQDLQSEIGNKQDKSAGINHGNHCMITSGGSFCLVFCAVAWVCA